MGNINTIPARDRISPTKPRAKACETLPAYGVSDGAISFRHSLSARERSAIDKALQIVGRCLRGEPGVTMYSPDAVIAYLLIHLAAENRELFAALYLDSQNRAIAYETLFAGTLTQTSVYPREVLKAEIAHNAHSVVFAYNHPSGSLQPSREDELMTRHLKAALAMIDVRVLDHVIIAGKTAFSMANEGLL